jgi:CMP-N,N'-diacetyllegionaminic acid synthase
MKKKLIAFIPARSGSKRIINKNLQKINGKSLVYITIEQAINSKIFDQVYLSSDSDRILKEGKKFSINSIKRSKKQSTDLSTMEEVLIDFIKSKKIKAENLILLQPTSPLRSTKTIRNFSKFCLEKKLKKCLTASEINDQISLKKKYFSSLYDYNIRRTQDRRSFLYENSLLYFVNIKYFLKTKSLYDKNWPYYITNKYESLDINTLEDLKIAKKIY